MDENKNKLAPKPKATNTPTPRKAVDRVNEKSVGLNIFLDSNPTGASHYAEMSRSFPKKKDENGEVTEWDYTRRLYKKHLKLLEVAARKAYERIEQLDEVTEDEQYPEMQQTG